MKVLSVLGLFCAAAAAHDTIGMPTTTKLTTTQPATTATLVPHGASGVFWDKPILTRLRKNHTGIVPPKAFPKAENLTALHGRGLPPDWASSSSLTSLRFSTAPSKRVPMATDSPASDNRL